MRVSASFPSIETISLLVSSRVGVIRSLTRLIKGEAEPQHPILYRAIASQLDQKRNTKHLWVGVGKGETDIEAIAGAVGETLERYCSVQVPPGCLQNMAFKEIADVAINPREFILYSENQYRTRSVPFSKFDESQEIAWVRAVEIPGKNEVFVPASLVYMHYGSDCPNQAFCSVTSSGLATASSLDLAILSGLCELIERDSFLFHFMNRIPPDKVPVSEFGSLGAAISYHYGAFGVEMHMFALRTDLAPYVMMSVTVDRTGKGPAIAIGLGCHLNPRIAIRKSLLELCQAHHVEAWNWSATTLSKKPQCYSDVRFPLDHSGLFSRLEMIREMDFLLAGQSSAATLQNRSTEDSSNDLVTCLQSLKTAGIRAFYVDVTTPDIAALGLSVVRVLASQLQPIHFGFQKERLGGTRLYQLPRLLGYTLADSDENTLNRCPHPLS